MAEGMTYEKFVQAIKDGPESPLSNSVNLVRRGRISSAQSAEWLRRWLDESGGRDA